MQFDRLGPYEIGEELGKGGMGAVYRARHIETGEEAAIKALAPQLGMAEGFRERFEAEIESLKKLRHEGIVRLRGYGEQDGVLFYSMEVVEGTSLEDEITAGRRFDWREVTQLAIQICHALKHAHDHGIVHRDIKPANLLLDPSGRVKIADFGIARLFGGTQLTSAGGVLGTADYMSPEQADGRTVTDRCDQYSLGGVMYALLAGRPPFRAKNLPEMLQMQRFAAPEPVRRFAPQTPEQLEMVVMQLLSKEPEDRFPNVLVLGRHLEAMHRALSRPPKDGFSLAPDAGSRPTLSEADDEFSRSLALETTRVQSPTADLGVGEGRATTAEPKTVPDEPTAEEATRLRASELTGPITQQFVGDDDELSLEESIELPPVPVQSDRLASPIQTLRTRFTTVEEEARRERDRDHAPFAIQIVKIVGLLAVIAAVVWGVQILTRPPGADELFESIHAAANNPKVEKLYTVEDQINDFLARFDNDPRKGEVAGFLDEIKSSREERRLKRIADSNAVGAVLLPIETMYIDAVRLAVLQPEESIRRLEAILTLYGAVEEEEPGRTEKLRPDSQLRTTLTLVRKRLREYRRREEVRAESHLLELEERIAAADKLATIEPSDAIAMYQAIITLYRDSPWATEAVAHAKRAIENAAAAEEE